MEIRFVHHAVTLGHPAMLAAVLVPGILAWVISGPITRLALSARTLWRRVLYTALAVPVIAAFVVLLTFLVFEFVWRHTEGPDVFVAFGQFNRFALLLPLVTVLAGVTRQVRRKSRKDTCPGPNAV